MPWSPCPSERCCWVGFWGSPNSSTQRPGRMHVLGEKLDVGFGEKSFLQFQAWNVAMIIFVRSEWFRVTQSGADWNLAHFTLVSCRICWRYWMCGMWRPTQSWGFGIYDDTLLSLYPVRGLGLDHRSLVVTWGTTSGFSPNSGMRIFTKIAWHVDIKLCGWKCHSIFWGEK